MVSTLPIPEKTYSEQMIIEETVAITAPHDWELKGTLIHTRSPAPDAPVILMSSASGVPHGYYLNFARHLIRSGAAAVLTYDYRGMMESAGDRKRWRELRMFHWAQYDLPACVQWLTERFPERELVGVAHSFGGQALGLSGASHMFARYVTVATMSGYWKNLDTPFSIWFQTQIVGRFFANLLGYIPKPFGPGGVFPGPVFLDWANWIANPDYWFDANDVPGLENFDKVTIPFLSIGVRDDPWGTKAAIESFMKHYKNADFSQEWVDPGESGPIGHLGFFRKRHQAHWRRITDYILNGG